ncbi:MAG: NADPH-dependent FMN reductase [Gammaproteobacteria bacterium]
MTVRILGLSGSLRAGSFNSAALRAATELAPEDTTLEIGSIRDIPLYDDDIRAAGIPASVTALQEQILAADAVLIATPEYNYSIPGVLKNAIDWLSRLKPQPFNEKPVGIIGASMGGIGTARAQYDLRKTFVFLNAYVLTQPEVMISAAHTRFDAEGRLTDEATRKFVANAIAALRDWTLRLKR